MQASLNRVLLLKKTTSGELRMVTGQHMLTSTRMWPPETLSYLRPAPTNDGRTPMVETAEALEDAFDVSVFGLEPFNYTPESCHIKPHYQPGLFRFHVTFGGCNESNGVGLPTKLT